MNPSYPKKRDIGRKNSSIMYTIYHVSVWTRLKYKIWRSKKRPNASLETKLCSIYITTVLQIACCLIRDRTFVKFALFNVYFTITLKIIMKSSF